MLNRPWASGTLQTNSAPIGAFGTKANPEIWMDSAGSFWPGWVQVTVNPCERVTPPALPGVEELNDDPPPGKVTEAVKAPISAPPEPANVYVPLAEPPLGKLEDE